MASLAGLRVLLAEDNPTNQMVALQMLETLGADVVLAEDGVRAVECADAEQFDIGLIDIEMPRLSGTDVIRRLRAGPPPHRDIPLIALTAYVMREHRAAISDAGADGVIAKPILSIEQLGEDIMSFVHARNGQEPALAAVGAGAQPDLEASAPPAATGSLSPGAGDAPPEMDLGIYDQLASTIGPAGIADLLQRVELDMLDVRRRLEESAERGDTKTLRDASHVLISVAGSLGAIRLQKDAQCLNSAAHSGDIAQMESMSATVLEELGSLMRFIRSKRQG